jgi:uncharacterized protein YndB with AHSA1/START domain
MADDTQMRTINLAETRSISIGASPAAVHEYLADARRLPEWAPAFATEVRPKGGHWVVTQGATELDVAILANRDCGTVDIVAAANHSLGAFLRVLPNGPGSELLFTLLFAPDTPEHQIEAQMTTVENELAAVRQACQ